MAERGLGAQAVMLQQCLLRHSLRYIEEHSGIGKNRLHALRRFPLDAKLYELLQLREARFITVELGKPPGVARRPKRRR